MKNKKDIEKERLVAVLAGNKTQFDLSFAPIKKNLSVRKEGGYYWIGKTKYFYVSGPEKLMGMEINEYIIIGTFFERNDCYELQELADSRIKN